MITLQSPISVTITRHDGFSKSITVSTLNVLQIMDSSIRQTVTAYVQELPGNPLVLWEGDSYKAIGDWTAAQAEAQIIQMVTSMSTGK